MIYAESYTPPPARHFDLRRRDQLTRAAAKRIADAADEQYRYWNERGLTHLEMLRALGEPGGVAATKLAVLSALCRCGRELVR